MDYFLSSGQAIEPISSTVNTIPTNDLTITLTQQLNQYIPSEFLSLIDLPLTIIVFIWILVIIWILKDSNYRSSSTSFCLFSLLLVTLWTPIIGVPIYLAIRPLGYKHERKYWKAMSESMEQAEIIVNEEEFIEEIEDQNHIAELKAKAQLAEKRIKKTVNKKSAPVKKTVNKIPTAKKAVTRTTQK